MAKLSSPLDNLPHYSFDSIRGFLPPEDPLRSLPKGFEAWEEISRELPKLLAGTKLRETVKALPELSVSKLTSRPELERAMLIVSYLGHAYVWNSTPPAKSIPAVLAKPWHDLAKKLERKPILSYPSYALFNWKRIKADSPIELGNIALIQNFWGGLDEEWFILVHVDIEAKAGAPLVSLMKAQQAAIKKDVDELGVHLRDAVEGLDRIVRSLGRMPEGCDPYIYYTRVRPYIHGWKNNPSLPEGLMYEGVDEYKGKPQQFRGETGAQGTIIPCIDAMLGIQHKDDPLKEYLLEMREYMPAGHRALLNDLEKLPPVRLFLAGFKASHPEVVELFNQCVTYVERFRTTHLDYAASYINRQAQRSGSNPTEIGTGGTPFMQYLAKHRDESKEHLI